MQDQSYERCRTIESTFLGFRSDEYEMGVVPLQNWLKKHIQSASPASPTSRTQRKLSRCLHRKSANISLPKPNPNTAPERGGKGALS